MRICLLLIGCLYCFAVSAQEPVAVNPIDNVLHIDTLRYQKDAPFVKQWEYPWWVIKHPDGHFENTLGDTIKAEDTVHQYYTAYVKTSHQGNHIMKYCKAELYKDTLLLTITSPGAAYSGWLLIKIAPDKTVSSQWSGNYMKKIPDEMLRFTTTSQSLSVNTDNFKPGSTIKGLLSVGFREDFSAPNHNPETFNHRVSGIFQTIITVKP